MTARRDARLTAGHPARPAIVYVRQPGGTQVRTDVERRRLRYALEGHARALGFGRLPQAVCGGSVGLVLAIGMSRLARNGRDWHALTEIRAVVGRRQGLSRDQGAVRRHGACDLPPAVAGEPRGAGRARGTVPAPAGRLREDRPPKHRGDAGPAAARRTGGPASRPPRPQDGQGQRLEQGPGARLPHPSRHPGLSGGRTAGARRAVSQRGIGRSAQGRPGPSPRRIWRPHGSSRRCPAAGQSVRLASGRAFLQETRRTRAAIRR